MAGEGAREWSAGCESKVCTWQPGGTPWCPPAFHPPSAGAMQPGAIQLTPAKSKQAGLPCTHLPLPMNSSLPGTSPGDTA